MTYHRTEKYEYEASRNRNFCKITKDNCIGESDESRNGLLQDIHFAHQNIGRFCSRWNFPQEGCVPLNYKNWPRKIKLIYYQLQGEVYVYFGYYLSPDIYSLQLLFYRVFIIE